MELKIYRLEQGYNRWSLHSHPEGGDLIEDGDLIIDDPDEDGYAYSLTHKYRRTYIKDIPPYLITELYTVQGSKFHPHEIESLEQVVIKAPISADELILAARILGAMASRGYNIADVMRAYVASRHDAAQIFEAVRQMFGEDSLNQPAAPYRVTLKFTPKESIKPNEMLYDVDIEQK